MDVDTDAAAVVAVRARRFRGLRRQRSCGVLVPVAERPLARLLGLALLDRERAGPGLLLPRCSAVHTLGMRFELDVVFLDEAGRPLRVERDLRRRRFLREPGAAAVLEVPARRARELDGGADGGAGVVEGVQP